LVDYAASDGVDSGRVVASLDRKRLGAEVWGGAESRSEAFSIRRLEGSRWRLRRTLVMGIEWRFCTWKTEDELPSRDESSVGFVLELTIRPEHGLESVYRSDRTCTGRRLGTRMRRRAASTSVVREGTQPYEESK
jgi:hypothetical protein